jgi:hypothetical protein
MTTVNAASQALLSASLMGIMNAAQIGSVPVEVVGGHDLRFGVAGSEQHPIHTLINWGISNICVESIEGYWESGTEGIFKSNAQVHRAWLEDGDFYKDWKGLQEQVNWVNTLGGSALATAARRTSSPFMLALLNEGMGNRGMALEKYVEAASDHSDRGEHALAAMVWEYALATLVSSERVQYESAFRRETALSFLESLGDFEMPYEPHRLKLARGLWYAYTCDRPVVYNALLMKWTEYNEKRSAPIERVSNELRLALSVLNRNNLDSKDWTTASEMIKSAVTLLGGVKNLQIDVDMLLGLAAETAALATTRPSIPPHHRAHDPTQR